MLFKDAHKVCGNKGKSMYDYCRNQAETSRGERERSYGQKVTHRQLLGAADVLFLDLGGDNIGAHFITICLIVCFMHFQYVFHILQMKKLLKYVN